MLQFDNKIVEKALLDHYENPKILTYLNEKGEQVIHLKSGKCGYYDGRYQSCRN